MSANLGLRVQSIALFPAEFHRRVLPQHRVKIDLLSSSVLSRQREKTLWSYSAIYHNSVTLGQSCFCGTPVTGGWLLWQQEMLAVGEMENVIATCPWAGFAVLAWSVEEENALREPGQ